MTVKVKADIGNDMKNKPFKKPQNFSGGGQPGTGLWLYGDHAVRAAWQNPQRQCLRLLATRTAYEENAAFFQKTSLKRPPVEITDRDKIDRILGSNANTVHQGLALEVKPLPDMTLDQLCAAIAEKDKAVILILDQVSDPHNVGAVLRSAAAFGADAVIVQDRHAPDESGVLAKSASGALELTPIVRVTNINHTIKDLKDNHIWVAGFSEHTEQDIARFDWPKKVALCLGNEGDGLRRLVMENCDFMLRLPTSPAFPSLNISNAAAIALYAASTSIQ